MKRLSITCLCLLLAAAPALCQQKHLKRFQREYYGKANTFRIGLGFLVKMGGAIMPARAIDGEDGVLIKSMLRKVSRMKLYMITAEDSGTIDNMAIRRLKQTLIDKSGLEPLLEVRDNGSSVFMLNKGNGDELGNVVVLVKDEKELVMLHFHTRMHLSDIQPLIDRAVAKNNDDGL